MTTIPFAWMRRAVDSGEAEDISDCPREGKYYLLDCSPCFGIEYLDVKGGYRMRSIGRRKADGAILAAPTNEFYAHPDYACLWAL